jgi:hypothetical protein
VAGGAVDELVELGQVGADGERVAVDTVGGGDVDLDASGQGVVHPDRGVQGCQPEAAQDLVEFVAAEFALPEAADQVAAQVGAQLVKRGAGGARTPAVALPWFGVAAGAAGQSVMVLVGVGPSRAPLPKRWRPGYGRLAVPGRVRVSRVGGRATAG